MSKARALGRLGEDILRHALNTVRAEDNLLPGRVNLYLRQGALAKNASLSVAGVARRLPTQAPALHVYADLAPLHNWAHPVRHLFYHPESGVLQHSEYDNFPPDDFESGQAFEPLHVPLLHHEPPAPASQAVFGRRFFLPARAAGILNLPQLNQGQRYAILFSGCSNNRHLNDLEFLYRVLVNVYQYPPNNIIVLNYDGTLNYSGGPQPVGNWPGDNTPYLLRGRINGPGTRAAFDNALAQLASRLTPQDSLLIHTNNHGGQNGSYREPWLCGYPNFSLVYKASEFGQRIKTLPRIAALIVGMEQCFSGAFMSPTMTNSPAAVTSFASAVPANLSSMGGPDFDPWARDWIAAFMGANPDGSPLQLPVPPNPSVLEAFNYSDAVHVPGDLPQYTDNPGGSGTTLHI